MAGNVSACSLFSLGLLYKLISLLFYCLALYFKYYSPQYTETLVIHSLDTVDKALKNANKVGFGLDSHIQLFYTLTQLY